MTTYSEWRASPYNTGDPATSLTCQGCHSNGHSGIGEEQLRAAAQVKLASPELARPGEELRLQVEVRNVGAGHSLPTGSSEMRKVWLEVTVTDASGQELFRSGVLDEYGDPDEQAVIYGTVWKDDRGGPTVRKWRAAEPLYDHRIPPQGSVTETYVLALPQDVQGPLDLRAVLRYRPVSGYYAGILSIVAGSQPIEAPVTEMARDEAVIEVVGTSPD